MTFSETPTDAEIEAAKAGLDEIGQVMIDSMTMRGVHNSIKAQAIQRLDPMYVSEAFVESVERDLFRTKDDTGSNSNALLVWNRVRTAAGLDRLTKDDLVRRTVDSYYDDASRAEARGDYENSDRYRGIARTIMAENPRVYPVPASA